LERFPTASAGDPAADAATALTAFRSSWPATAAFGFPAGAVRFGSAPTAAEGTDVDGRDDS
jgi:hypothetical protein